MYKPNDTILEEVAHLTADVKIVKGVIAFGYVSFADDRAPRWWFAEPNEQGKWRVTFPPVHGYPEGDIHTRMSEKELANLPGQILACLMYAGAMGDEQ